MKNKRTLGFELTMLIKAIRKETRRPEHDMKSFERIHGLADTLLGITTDNGYQEAFKAESYLGGK